MNVVVVSGRLSGEPTVRELKSGIVVMNLELSTQFDGTAVTVPLIWFDPPSLTGAGAGDEISAVGTVQRRFFRTGGATQSRTEVVVAHLARSTDRRARGAQHRWLADAMGSDLCERLRSQEQRSPRRGSAHS